MVAFTPVFKREATYEFLVASIHLGGTVSSASNFGPGFESRLRQNSAHDCLVLHCTKRNCKGGVFGDNYGIIFPSSP